MRRSSVLLSSVGVLTAGVFTLPVQAALILNCGPTICYEYDNNPAANAGIVQFGAPTLLPASDILKFTPTNFNADSDPGTLRHSGAHRVGGFPVHAGVHHQRRRDCLDFSDGGRRLPDH